MNQYKLHYDFQYENKQFVLQRYPITTNKSLQAWNNADILVIDYIFENNLIDNDSSIYLYNDRFGIWNCLLAKYNLTSIYTHKSQKKSVGKNLLLNGYFDDQVIKSPVDKLEDVELAIIKIPKSLDLFELFLHQIHHASTSRTKVLCSFMTKYFTNSLLKIASLYFEDIQQTKAWKKSRLLILKSPKKEVQYRSLYKEIFFNKKKYIQFFGVFSAEKVDIGTQFLLEQFKKNKLCVKKNEINIVDLACGNGVIAREILDDLKDQDREKKKVTLVDDFNLAIESAKINMSSHPQVEYLCDDNLQKILNNTVDLVISNPPFHFEHENNIEISLSLFKDVKRVLNIKGRFILVANKHLNYKVYLQKIFTNVFVIAVNKKFVIYECKG